MSIFTNLEDFADREKIYMLLVRLEQAHKEQDELACGILLTRLKNENITIVVAESGENVVQ